MVKITLQNSTCQLSGLGNADYAALQEHISYTDQQAEYSFQKIIKQLQQVNALLNDKTFGSNPAELKQRRAFLSKEADKFDKLRKVTLVEDNKFPSGLLPMILDWLDQEKLKWQIDDKRVEPKKNSVKIMNKLPFPDFRYYQEEAVKNLMVDGRGIVVLPTGTGKTVTAAKMIWELGVRTLIITPNKEITKMMREVMVRYFGSGSVDVLNTKSVKIKKSISIVNIQALIKIDPSVMKGIDAVFIDEFHHSAATTYQEVNEKHLKDVYFRIGLTATNFRNDGSDLALQGVLSEVLYEYSVKQAIDDGFLVKPTFEITKNKISTQETQYQKVYREGIVENEGRNQIIAELAKEVKDEKTIILVQYKEHGERLKELIPWAEFIHGEETDDARAHMMEDFRDGELMCLIGTSVIGEGVDLPCAENLIMAGGGKARSQVIQNIGRVLRIFAGKVKATIFDFTDRDGGFLEEHSLERSDIYTMYE
jgi:superfamily II DNA or RNA helicase